MSTSASQRSNPLAGLWRRLQSWLIAEVPEDIAICEFDCSKNQCTYGEWATCQRRIQIQALCHPNPVEPAKEATGPTPSHSRSDRGQS